jgi:hypothetical protein
VTNITNGTTKDLGTFTVPDKFNARAFRMHFNFSYVRKFYLDFEISDNCFYILEF